MHIPNESALLRRARQRAQDRSADAITRFAGSMLFVYLHVGWWRRRAASTSFPLDYSP